MELLLILYFIPTIIAILNRKNAGAILILNTLFGWTIIGWVAAFILAF